VLGVLGVFGFFWIQHLCVCTLILELKSEE
jgi:hypothetical protein